MRTTRVVQAVMLGGLVAAVAAAPSSADSAKGSAAAAACAKATNIEAIIDDSGSMGATDATGCGCRRWTC